MNKQDYIIGAAAGDIIGSVYEFNNKKTTDFDLYKQKSTFTDDSVLTFATMDALLTNKNYTEKYQRYGKKYPGRGYGGRFYPWIYEKNPKPYNSWGNGSAMRASPIGWFCNSLDEVMDEANNSAIVSHNHPEGIKGAQAAAVAVFMARTGKTKEEIKSLIRNTFLYDLDRKLDIIRPNYRFDESCQGTVPEAIIAFLESTDYESAIRLAISIGGDSDTIACITGGIAEAYYREIPDYIIKNTLKILPKEIIKLIEIFSAKYKRFE